MVPISADKKQLVDFKIKIKISGLKGSQKGNFNKVAIQTLSHYSVFFAVGWNPKPFHFGVKI
jgi:hypothetical protein